MHPRTFTRAAGVSPPWFTKRTCRTVRFAFGEQRHQERRASARRGSRIAPARTIPQRSAHDHRTQHQERRASARRGSEIVPARTIPGTSAHARLTQRQERRASARRGSRIAPADRFALRSANNATKSGGRQPAVAHETHLPCSSIYFWQTTPQQKPRSDRRGSIS